jgi:hypothetical protein
MNMSTIENRDYTIIYTGMDNISITLFDFLYKDFPHFPGLCGNINYGLSVTEPFGEYVKM